MKKLKISNETLSSLELVKGDMQILSAKMQHFLVGGEDARQPGVTGGPGPRDTYTQPRPGTPRPGTAG